jgi:hypothetical protein
MVVGEQPWCVYGGNSAGQDPASRVQGFRVMHDRLGKSFAMDLCPPRSQKFHRSWVGRPRGHHDGGIEISSVC